MTGGYSFPESSSCTTTLQFRSLSLLFDHHKRGFGFVLHQEQQTAAIDMIVNGFAVTFVVVRYLFRMCRYLSVVVWYL